MSYYYHYYHYYHHHCRLTFNIILLLLLLQIFSQRKKPWKCGLTKNIGDTLFELLSAEFGHLRVPALDCFFEHCYYYRRL